MWLHRRTRPATLLRVDAGDCIIEGAHSSPDVCDLLPRHCLFRDGWTILFIPNKWIDALSSFILVECFIFHWRGEFLILGICFQTLNFRFQLGRWLIFPGCIFLIFIIDINNNFVHQRFALLILVLVHVFLSSISESLSLTDLSWVPQLRLRAASALLHLGIGSKLLKVLHLWDFGGGVGSLLKYGTSIMLCWSTHCCRGLRHLWRTVYGSINHNLGHGTLNSSCALGLSVRSPLVLAQ